MKLQNNQSVIDFNGYQRSDVTVNTAENKASSQLYGVAAKGFGDAFNEYVESERVSEAERVMQADNEITKRLEKLKLDINENMQGSKAAGAQSYFEQEAQKIKDDVYSKSGIRYQIGQKAFNKSTENNIINGSVAVSKWQSGQMDDARLNTLALFSDNKLKDVLDGSSLSKNYQDVMAGIEFAFANKPPEVVTRMKRTISDTWLQGVVSKAISEDDYDTADKAVSFFGNSVSAATKSKIQANLQSNKEYSEINKTASDLIAQGVTSYEGVAEALKKNVPATGKYKLNSGVSVEGAKDYTQKGIGVAAAIYNDSSDDDIYVTSVTDSTEIHAGGKGVKGSHANGDKADIASDRLANDTEFRQQYIEKLEAAGIHVINEYDNPSENSTGGHLDLDFSDYKAQPQVSQQKIDKIYAKVQQLSAIKKHDEKVAVIEQYDACHEECWELQQSGVTDPAAFDRIIGKYTGQSKELDAKLSTLSNAFGSSAAGKASKLNPIAKEELVRSIKYFNRFADKDVLNQYMDSMGIMNVNDRKDLLDAQQEGLRTGYKEAVSMGIESASSALNKDEKSSYEKFIKPQVERLVEKDIEEYKAANNGAYPSASDVVEYAKKAATKSQIEVTSGWFGFGGLSVNASPAQMQALDIAEINKLPDGNFEVVKYTKDFDNATGRINGAPTKSFEMTPGEFYDTVGVLLK